MRKIAVCGRKGDQGIAVERRKGKCWKGRTQWKALLQTRPGKEKTPGKNYI